MPPRFLDQFPEYCSLLLLGPPGVGKFEYLAEALRAYLKADQSVLFVCVDVSPTEVLEFLRRTGVDLGDHLGRSVLFVDCHSASMSDQVVPEAEGVLLVSSLSNLEGIGMAMTKAMTRLPMPVKVLFYTISTLFLHNSSQSLSKCCQVISARVKSQVGLILWACHQGVIEERQEKLLQSLVDGVVEVRFREDMRREVRLHHLRGHRVDPTWVPLNATDGRPPGGGSVTLEAWREGP